MKSQEMTWKKKFMSKQEELDDRFKMYKKQKVKEEKERYHNKMVNEMKKYA